MKVVLLLVAVVLPLAAEWDRQILTPKGIRMDTPKPHRLSYFTRYPWLRDEDDELCYLCPPEKRLAKAKQRKARAEVRLVGKIRGYSIYDVLYFFEEELLPRWKSILVRTQPDQYREIWHYQKNEGGIWPSFLVKVGNETILGLQDDCYRQGTIQEYFWFGADGPTPIDFGPIWKAAEVEVPKGTHVWRGFDGRIDLPAGRMRVGLIRDPDWRCCSAGVVEVTFELRGGRILVTGKRLIPTADFHWGRGCR